MDKISSFSYSSNLMNDEQNHELFIRAELGGRIIAVMDREEELRWRLKLHDNGMAIFSQNNKANKGRLEEARRAKII